MKIAGIICEYNPFHNGHKYQIEMLKRDYDGIICLMSGSFVQRGDVAIFDKWTRAKAALLSGCDLVIELPCIYALSSAQGFAKGSIDILNSTGIVNSLSFGSECGDILALNIASEVLMNESDKTSEKIKMYLKEGYSFPVAREKAYAGMVDKQLLCEPNNILALEYIMELKKQKSSIIPITHQRTDNGYHSTENTGKFASASHLRNLITSGAEYSDYVPFDYSNYTAQSLDGLSDIFRYLLISRGKEAFNQIADMEDGLDNRFLQAINCGSISQIVEKVKTKRYTRTRLQRIVCRVLLGLTTDTPKPQYIRVLGMSKTGMAILSEIKKKSSYPIVNKVADFKDESIKKDIFATDLSELCKSSVAVFGKDYTTSPIII